MRSYVGNAISRMDSSESTQDAGSIFHGAADELLKNNGDGTWTSVRPKVMARAGSDDYSGLSDARHTRAVAWGDYDADGDLDLLIGSGTVYTDADGNKAYVNNELWKNNGDGTLTEVTGTSITNTLPSFDKGAGIFVAWGDADVPTEWESNSVK